MTTPDETTVAALAEVLAEHWLNGSHCDCGWRIDYEAEVWWVDQHAAHDARDLLASPALADLLRAERVRALRGAADDTDLSAYYDPSPSGRVSTSCHLAENATRDWLRDRAEREAER